MQGVTSIGQCAFLGLLNVTNVTIPEGVTQIGNAAFLGCFSLTNITIPGSVTSIRSQAFGCCKMTSFAIPEGVTSIGSYAFENCSRLTSITIPESVTWIGEAIFRGCSELADIKVAEKNIYYNSKNECNAIINTKTNELISGCQSTVIPNDEISIGSYAFWGCSGLTSITIPESVTSIGSQAFSDCRGLTNIKVAEGNAYYNSKNECNAIIETKTNELISGCKLTVIPSDVTSIGDYAFWGCSELTSIIIPESVTSIGDYAFGVCSGLTSIIIPESVTLIGNLAFDACYGLTSITLLNKEVAITNNAIECVSENCIIYGYTGSTAESYATEHGLTFKVIGSTDDSNNNDSGNSDNSNTGTDNSGTNGGTTGDTGSDASNSGAGGSGSGAAAGGSAAQPSGSDSTGVTGATGSASNSETSSTTETGTTTSKIKLTTKNTTIKLSKTSYTYDGKAKKPKVKVLNSKGKVLKSSNYTVKYSNNVKSGKATVTIKFKGKYTGTIKATYTIKPKTTAITGATRNGSKVALIWKKQATQTSGYQIQYATDKKFTKDKQLVTVSGAKKTSKTIKNLSENKNYYFRIRTYKTVNGKKIYSSWSKAKLIK